MNLQEEFLESEKKEIIGGIEEILGRVYSQIQVLEYVLNNKIKNLDLITIAKSKKLLELAEIKKNLLEQIISLENISYEIQSSNESK